MRPPRIRSPKIFMPILVAIGVVALLYEMHRVKLQIPTQLLPPTNHGSSASGAHSSETITNFSMNSIRSKQIMDIKEPTTDTSPVQTRLKLMQNNVKDLPIESTGGVEHEIKFAERRQRLQLGCDKHRNQASFGGVEHFGGVLRNRLLWLNREKIVVCMIAKVASSSWCNYLLNHYLNGSSKSEGYGHRVAQRLLAPQPGLTGKETLQQLNSFTKILTVRHPFARLVSAYRNKAEPCINETTCYVKTRNIPLSPKALFKDFAEYLIETVKVPVLADDAAYQSFDLHWIPYFLNCKVCDLSYEYIVKMETWNDDLSYLLPKYHIEYVEKAYGDILNSSDVSFQYFKTLPESLVLKLYEIYKIDFELFGYSLDGYLQ
ncbi:carbohydrate sulfotransferase 11-like isoform X1 [Hyalella azteca]|uniref:Carbohydrate sulfotransferase n=1 Tax=Hyalella azteca TaxID=294128 RepID=A0A8B7ND37_HYAAZ|nr:carbohydrate sulfotransferase 11-like isoform X1 [Hyalella azteca]